MFSKMKMTMRGRSAAVTEARLVLVFCLLGLASASAQTVFNVTGTLSSTSTFSGTVTIDTITPASDAAVLTANIAIAGAPDGPSTCSGAPNFQGHGGAAGYYFNVSCTTGGPLMLTLLTPLDTVNGYLFGYAGGGFNMTSTNASNFGGTEDPVTGGSLTPAPVAVGPGFTKAFSPSTIQVGGTSTLTFTIYNTNALILTGVAFSDALPANLLVATPNGLSTNCGAAVTAGLTATAGSGSIILALGTVAASTSCTISVNVVGIAPSADLNTTSTLFSNEAPLGSPATCPVTVVLPPTISKVFAQTALQLFGANTTALTFTITNPAANPVPLGGIAFTDTLPNGLVISTPNGLTGSCGGGPITATAGTNVISLTGATLDAGVSCTFSVNVSATAIGAMVNTTSTVTALAGTIVGGTATATTWVAATLWLWFFSDGGGGGGHP